MAGYHARQSLLSPEVKSIILAEMDEVSAIFLVNFLLPYETAILSAKTDSARTLRKESF